VKSEVFPDSVEADEMPRARGSDRFGVTAALSFAYLLVALMCIIQWDAAHPWARVDLFSGGYLGLRFFGALHSLVSSRRAFRSSSLTREWWGQTSNPAIVKWVILLMLGDLMVFLDYGHWHIISSLERPAVQFLGLVLYLFTAVWQIWTDSYLARHFNDDRFREAPTVVGPFRHIRHPRYAAAILGKIALALVFASLLGWLLLLPWTVLLLQKVRAEEAHLRRSFGARYAAYARRTARLLPGVY
jgi:protein-S-isoprenylcysteine O-methyltransferase Ste14